MNGKKEQHRARFATINVDLVFDDWRLTGNVGSIYDTELGVKLSSRDLHSGTVIPAVLTIGAGAAKDIQRARDEHGAYPVFSVIVMWSGSGTEKS